MTIPIPDSFDDSASVDRNPSPTSPGATGAQRLQKDRDHLKTRNVVRAEILVPTVVRDQVRAVAASEGAGYLDTLSALAQLGLESYRNQSVHPVASLAAPASSLPSMSANAQGASASLASPVRALSAALPANAAGTSPIARFLLSRKDS